MKCCFWGFCVPSVHALVPCSAPGVARGATLDLASAQAILQPAGGRSALAMRLIANTEQFKRSMMKREPSSDGLQPLSALLEELVNCR